MGNSFRSELSKKVKSNLWNNHNDNWDKYRYGKQPDTSSKSRLKTNLKLMAYNLGVKDSFTPAIFSERSEEFEKLYNLLADDRSKKLLVDIMSFRMLGHQKVKLPLAQSFDEIVAKLESMPTEKSKDDEKFNVYDVNHLGYPMKLEINNFNSIFHIFSSSQYEYTTDEGEWLGAKEGDVVIDAGGCFGDTALYFSHLVKSEGKVFVYEFIPSNLKVLQRNFDRNPELSSRVVIKPKPVWSESGLTVGYIDKGAGSRVSFGKLENQSGSAETLTIDDMVKEHNLDKVDFIKMDIEGAEPEALKGAVETIKKFRPTMSIALYHSLSDFVDIPLFIDKLGLNYKFYMHHATIHSEETVIFAKPV